MKVAFLITAYKNPEQIDQFIKLWENPNFHFYIHLDKKIDINIFSFLTKRLNVKFISNRILVRWATFSTAESVLVSLKEILAERGDYDYINLMSGQDFPLMRATDFIEFLNINRGNQYINCFPYDLQTDWWSRNESRVNTYNFQDWHFPGKYKIQYIFNLLFKKRPHPKGFVLAGNSNWFCLTADCVAYMLKTLDETKGLKKFFKYVWGADEFIFSTLAYNSPFRSKIKDNLVYMLWPVHGEAHPVTFRINDFDSIMGSGKVFARKFDNKVDDEILKKLESELLKGADL
jgi:hypothetical protein